MVREHDSTWHVGLGQKNDPQNPKKVEKLKCAKVKFVFNRAFSAQCNPYSMETSRTGTPLMFWNLPKRIGGTREQVDLDTDFRSKK